MSYLSDQVTTHNALSIYTFCFNSDLPDQQFTEFVLNTRLKRDLSHARFSPRYHLNNVLVPIKTQVFQCTVNPLSPHEIYESFVRRDKNFNISLFQII